MGKIYASASRTLIWLGTDPNGYGETAMNTINCLGERLCYNLGLTLSSLGMVQSFSSFSGKMKTNPIGTSSITANQWHAMKWFFSREWFCRLWVIRELNLSATALSYCGNGCADAHLISLVARQLAQIETAHKLLDGESYVYNAMRMRSRVFSELSSILLPLHYARSYKTTDARDRVYAMLSIPSFAHAWAPAKADYTMTSSQVFKAVVETSIRSSKNLLCLSFVQHSGQKVPNQYDTTGQPFPALEPA